MTTLMSVDELRGVVNHVFLPPKLPQQADEDSEIAIVNTTLQALIALREMLVPESPIDLLQTSIVLLENIRHIHSMPDGTIDEMRLYDTLASLPVGRALAAHIQSQNAGVLITRQADKLKFEAFELSPLAAAVNQIKGRLTRTFPGLVVAVRADRLNEADFTAMVAHTLSTMCYQPAPGMQ